MALYRYRAYDKDGKKVSDTCEAIDEKVLYKKLRSKGLYVYFSKEKRHAFNISRLSARELSVFCRSLGTLLNSGVDLVNAMNILVIESGTKKKLLVKYEELLKHVRQGEGISEAMDSMDGTFPELLIFVLGSAEMNGDFGMTLIRMAEYYEREHRVQGKIINAVIYPVFLFVLLLLVLTLLTTRVLPKFSNLIKDGMKFSSSARFLMWVGRMLNSYWWLIIIMVCICIGLVGIIANRPKFRYQIDRLKVHLPISGNLLSMVYTSRFAGALSSLYHSGIPISQAIDASKNTINNTYITEQFSNVLSNIKKGASLSSSIMTVDGLHNKLSASMLIGEETGTLGEMLKSAGDFLEEDANAALQNFITLFEPVMIIVVAVITGWIMISFMEPVLDSYKSLGSGGFV